MVVVVTCFVDRRFGQNGHGGPGVASAQERMFEPNCSLTMYVGLCGCVGGRVVQLADLCQSSASGRAWGGQEDQGECRGCCLAQACQGTGRLIRRWLLYNNYMVQSVVRVHVVVFCLACMLLHFKKQAAGHQYWPLARLLTTQADGIAAWLVSSAEQG